MRTKNFFPVHPTFRVIEPQRRKPLNELYILITTSKCTVMNNSFLYHTWGLYNHKEVMKRTAYGFRNERYFLKQ